MNGKILLSPHRQSRRQTTINGMKEASTHMEIVAEGQKGLRDTLAGASDGVVRLLSAKREVARSAGTHSCLQVAPSVVVLGHVIK